MAQPHRQYRPPHQLEYARDLPVRPVHSGAGDAAIMLLVWAGTIGANLALLVWLTIDLKPRMQDVGGGVAAILIFLELIASLCWATLLIAAARRFHRQETSAARAVVLYWRGKIVLALIAFSLSTAVRMFDLPGDKVLGVCIWASALCGLMVAGLLGTGYGNK